MLGTLLAGLVLLVFHALLFPRVSDPDAFYHWGHAAVYREAGPLAADFPWTAVSIIGEVGADLWYGLHLLVLPFAGGELGPSATPTRVAALLLAVGGMAVVARVATAHRWVAAPLWPALFLMAVPNVLFRYLSIRPEVLSIPLALLLMSGWVRGRVAVVALAAFGMAWIHLSMFWLIVGVGVAGAIGSAAAERRVDAGQAARLAGVLLGGLATGALLRPNPLGAVELAWVQIAELLFEKTGGAPLTFATELSPIGAGAVLGMAWPLVVVWGVAVAGMGVVGWGNMTILGGRVEHVYCAKFMLSVSHTGNPIT